MAHPSFAYPLRFEKARGTHIVHFWDLPEALTEGADVSEALVRAADALEEAIAARMVDREDIPAPSPPRGGDYIVVVPAATAAKAALYLAMREAKISNVALGRRLDIDERQVRRLTDPRHSSRLADLDRAMVALGCRIEVTTGPLARSVRKPRKAAKSPPRKATTTVPTTASGQYAKVAGKRTAVGAPLKGQAKGKAYLVGKVRRDLDIGPARKGRKGA